MRSGKLLLLVAMVFIVFSVAVGQETLSSDSLHWVQGLESYQQRDFSAAAIHFERIIKDNYSSLESAAWLMLARSYLHMDMSAQARQAAQKLICKFPHGRYAPYAHYALAQIDFRKERFLATALELLSAAQNTRDDGLSLLARSKLDRLYEIYLTDSQKQEVLAWTESPIIQADLFALQQGYRPLIKIGVILPLSGPRSDEGQRLLTGIELAAAEARKRQRLEVEVISRDSRGDVVEAVLAAKSLIHEEGVAAIIGDLEGFSSAAIAAVASDFGVPLIIPASQEPGLAEVGEVVYQLLPDFRMEGRAAAAYVTNALGVKRVAILAPASEEGRARVQGFQDGFTHAGGEITTVQWYYEETTNFRRQLEAIAYSDTPDSIAVSSLLVDSVRVDTLEAPLGSEISSSFELENQPINEVGALYLPVQGEEIALLAPQLAAIGFQRTLIGDAVCLDLVGRESIKRYVADMIFPAHYASNLGFDLESDFARLYQSKTNTWPDRWSLLGWDAFNFLSQALKDQNKISRAKVAEKLAGVRKFTGVRGELNFPTGRRVNHSMYMLNYVNGQLETVRSAQQVAQDVMHDQ